MLCCIHVVPGEYKTEREQLEENLQQQQDTILNLEQKCETLETELIVNSQDVILKSTLQEKEKLQAELRSLQDRNQELLTQFETRAESGLSELSRAGGLGVSSDLGSGLGELGGSSKLDTVFDSGSVPMSASQVLQELQSNHSNVSTRENLAILEPSSHLKPRDIIKSAKESMSRVHVSSSSSSCVSSCDSSDASRGHDCKYKTEKRMLHKEKKILLQQRDNLIIRLKKLTQFYDRTMAREKQKAKGPFK